MSILDTLEKELRRDIIESAREEKRTPLIRAFLCAVLISPFLLADFLFIPFLGQVLAIMAVALSLGYMWARRSWRLFVVSLAGAICSSLVVRSVSIHFVSQAAVGAYLVMGLCMAITLSYIVFITGVWWRFFEKAAAGRDMPAKD
jgi:hypothetical protein